MLFCLCGLVDGGVGCVGGTDFDVDLTLSKDVGLSGGFFGMGLRGLEPLLANFMPTEACRYYRKISMV